MTVRNRATERLERHVPDFSRWDRRQPACRLFGRLSTELRPGSRAPRPDPGASLTVREVRPPKLAKPARTEPNAPLLMRIVRYPFALTPGSGAVVVLIPPEPPRDRADTVRVGRAFRAFLTELRRLVGSPVAGGRPAIRWVPRPFARVAAAGLSAGRSGGAV